MRGCTVRFGAFDAALLALLARRPESALSSVTVSVLLFSLVAAALSVMAVVLVSSAYAEGFITAIDMTMAQHVAIATSQRGKCR